VSTHWEYVCVSHDPPISSDRLNHGADALRAALLLERDGKWPDDPAQTSDSRRLYGAEPAPLMHKGREHVWPIYWLRAHPRCTVVLACEYGEVMLPDGTEVMGRGDRNARRPVRGPHGVERWETVPFPEPPERLCACPDGGTPMGPTSAPGYLGLRPGGGWVRCGVCKGLIV
jgi:hypothetical protein